MPISSFGAVSMVIRAKICQLCVICLSDGNSKISRSD